MPPTPVAEGTLDHTPFAHVVLSVLRRRLSGTLAVWPDEERAGQDRILFRNGSPVAGRLLDPAETLERGLLPIFRRARAPYAFYEQDLVSASDGVLVSPCETLPLVAAALRGGGRDDAIDRVLGEFDPHRVRLTAGFDASVFRLTSKELAFIDLLRADSDTVGRLIELSGDPKTSRRVLYLLAITKQLERFRTTSDNVAIPDDIAMPSLEFEAPTAATATTSSGETPAVAPPRQQTPAAPSSSFGAPRPAVASPPASSMSSARPSQDKQRSRGHDSAAPPPPLAGLPPEAAARWADLADRVTCADTQNYFQVLGLDESAAAEQVRAAYFDAVKKVHPDRLPPEFAPLKPFVERLFQQITEAKENLENEEKRLKYIRTIREGGGTPESDRKMMLVLSAAYELDKATVLSNLGKWSDVLVVLDDVKSLDASQPDIYALEAWALFNLLGQHPLATLEHVLLLTTRVLADMKDGYHERALYTRALALKKLDREDEAIPLFKRIAERNPRNLDAAREVRIHEMRQREGPKRPDGGGGKDGKDSGLFSKLFGGKK